MIKKIDKLVIDRQRWGRGKTGGELQRPSDGLRCCLGFYCLQAGLSESLIVNRLASPRLSEDGWRGDEWPFDIGPLIGVNDSKSMSDAEREKRLTELFAERGIEVVFVDGE